ncbi:MAG TPA: mannosyltransferase family protein [Actinomycetes bacterium]|jgi:Mannosyltransferase (PIG-V)|nr:mannosyltransferase family protein [Actinomycetes bacterium]
MNLSLNRRGPAERPPAGDDPRPDGGPRPPADRRRGIRFPLLAFGTATLATVAMAVAVARVTGRSVLGILSRSDGGWYLAIAERGYPEAVPAGVGDQAQSTLAFFPGYPLLIQAASLTGLPPALAGIVVATLAGAAASVVLWLLAERVADARTANRAVLLFCFFPPAFVLPMVYSEALFFLLVGTCLLQLIRERWPTAGMAAALAGLVRPTGLVLTLCCGWAALAAIRRRRSWRPAIAPLLAPTGTLAFFAYLQVHTGDWLAYVHATRQGWGQGFDFGASTLRTLQQVVADRQFGLYIVMLGVTAAAVVVAGYLLVRWPLPAPVLIYVAGTAGIALLSSNITSLPRYLLAAFPVLIPVARQLSDESYPMVVAASATLMATLFWTTSLVPWLAP